MDFDKPLNESERNEFKKLLLRRLSNEPLQYITGETEFYGYKIKVDNRVLIPRQETEILVEEILKEIDSGENQKIKIFEIGTGSGCISIALARELEKKSKDYEITSIDISQDAINLALENVELNKLNSNKTKFLNESVFDLNYDLNEYNFIISNPPYISKNDLENLDSEVKDYEPSEALTDNGDGFKFYEKIFSIANNLKKGSFALPILSFNSKEKIEELLQKFNIKNYNFTKDLSGIDRVLKINI
ncbi:MAG TPA: peptide chain release factor N(5)-glutamine methyltransferase [Bacteroidetes bacterium]|nr:peptide chain release factor N(5)-glutamine methyltransferase [Bacteroidota bacterium]